MSLSRNEMQVLLTAIIDRTDNHYIASILHGVKAAVHGSDEAELAEIVNAWSVEKTKQLGDRIRQYEWDQIKKS